MIQPTPFPRGLYNKQRPGPSVDLPFTVTQGMVAVMGASETVNVTLFPGSTWPGANALSAPVREALLPRETFMIPHTSWQLNPQETELQAGLGGVTSQVLRALTIHEGLDLLVAVGINPLTINQTTLAAVLNRTREGVSKRLILWRAEHPELETR